MLYIINASCERLNSHNNKSFFFISRQTDATIFAWGITIFLEETSPVSDVGNRFNVDFAFE